MVNEISERTDVYLITGYTDLRKGVDGLSAYVQSEMQEDPYSGSLYLFCGKSRSKMKGLMWDGDGFLLMYKRLDNGAFRWPRTEAQARLLTKQEVRWLLEGLDIDQPKAIKKGSPAVLF